MKKYDITTLISKNSLKAIVEDQQYVVSDAFLVTLDNAKKIVSDLVMVDEKQKIWAVDDKNNKTIRFRDSDKKFELWKRIV